MAAGWKTVSMPFTAAAQSAGLSTFPCTISTSRPSTFLVGSLGSARTRTLTPRSRSARTMELPRKPQPPVTRAFFIRRLYRNHGLEVHPQVRWRARGRRRPRPRSERAGGGQAIVSEIPNAIAERARAVLGLGEV